jgi:tetratricopeptide (TPR) repeat protein
MDWDNLVCKADEQRKQGNHELVEKLLLQALELLSDCPRDDPRVINTLQMLSDLFLQLRRVQDADKHLSLLLYSEERAFGSGTIETTATLKLLAKLHYERKDYERSQLYCRKMYAIKRKHYGDKNLEVCFDAHTLAVLYHTGGQFELAEQLYKEALAISTGLLSQDSVEVSAILSNYAGLLSQLHRTKEAEFLMQCALGTSTPS